jgi:hypothetical protein
VVGDFSVTPSTTLYKDRFLHHTNLRISWPSFVPRNVLEIALPIASFDTDIHKVRPSAETRQSFQACQADSGTVRCTHQILAETVHTDTSCSQSALTDFLAVSGGLLLRIRAPSDCH